MADIDPMVAEFLAAAIGFEAFARRTLRKVAQYQIDRAAGIPAEIDRRILRFLWRKEPAATAELPDFDFHETAELLTTDARPSQVHQLIDAFEDAELGFAVVQVAGRIREQLLARLPRRVRTSLAGDELVEPPRSDMARFARAWAIACDPLAVLVDLNEYALSRDQVAVMAELYPLVYQRIQGREEQPGIPGVPGAVRTQIARIKAARPKFTLLRQKESLLAVLLQAPPPGLAVGLALQQMYAADAAAQQQAEARPSPRSRAPKSEGANAESTPAQRVDTE